MKTAFSTVDAYIASFDEPHRSRLAELRQLIKAAAPEATEGISYGMPAYKWQGVLVYFGGYKAHIGFYPMPSTIEAFADSLQSYATSKGTIQFPPDQPLPAALITAMLHFRLQRIAEKAALKKKL